MSLSPILLSTLVVLLAAQDQEAQNGGNEEPGSRNDVVHFAPAVESTKPWVPPFESSGHPSALLMFDWEHNVKSTVFDQKDGLPSVGIADLAYDHEGRLWIATAEGVVVYDGLRFKRIEPRVPDARTEPWSADPTAPEYASALLRDPRGGVWVGTRGGRLFHYASMTTRPRLIETELSRVTALFLDQSGYLWAGGNGVIRVAPDASKAEIMQAPALGSWINGIGQRRRPTGTESAPSPVWVAGNQGLWRWNGDAAVETVSPEACYGLFFDSADQRWEINRGQAIFKDGSPWGKLPRQDGRLHEVQELGDGRILIMMATRSWILNPRDGSVTPTKKRSRGSLHASLPAGERGLWLAREPGGLEYIEPKGYVTYEGEGLGHLQFPVSAFADDQLLVRVSGQRFPDVVGVTLGPDRSIKFESAVSPLSSLKPRVQVRDATALADGSLLVTTPRGILHAVGATVETLDLKDRLLRLITTTESGAVWYEGGGTLNEVKALKPTGRSFPPIADRLNHLVSSGERLYAALRTRVMVFDTESMTSSTLIDLGDKAVRHLWVESGHSEGSLPTVWVASYGAGLFRVRPNGNVDHWDTDDGLASNYLGWIGTVPGPTAETHLWINSNSGTMAVELDSLDHPPLRSRLIQTPESNGPLGAALPSGILMLPTMEGIVAIDTATSVGASPAPRLSLGAPLIKGVPHDPESPPYGVTDIQFPFSVVSFPTVTPLRVEFRLDGHDDEWIHAGQDRAPRYTNLAPGAYRFKLRVGGPGQAVGTPLEGAALVVLPMWYERRIVQALGLVFSLMLAVFLVRVRVASLKAQNEALEREFVRREVAEKKSEALRRQVARTEESERSRVARELHDDFSQRLVVLGLNLRLTIERSAPTVAGSVSQELEEAIGDIECLSKDLHSLSRRLHPTVLEDLGLGAALRSECRRRRESDGPTLLLNMDESLEHLRGETGLALFRVAQEALLNATRHGQAPHIDLTLSDTEQGIELCVIDSGLGMVPEEAAGRGSVGIASMRERMALIGGSLAIDSAPGQGTTVRALAPMPVLVVTPDLADPLSR